MTWPPPCLTERRNPDIHAGCAQSRYGWPEADSCDLAIDNSHQVWENTTDLDTIPSAQKPLQASTAKHPSQQVRCCMPHILPSQDISLAIHSGKFSKLAPHHGNNGPDYPQCSWKQVSRANESSGTLELFASKCRHHLFLRPFHPHATIFHRHTCCFPPGWSREKRFRNVIRNCITILVQLILLARHVDHWQRWSALPLGFSPHVYQLGCHTQFI